MDHFHYMAGTSSEVDFGAVGIHNPPSWSVLLADEAGNPRCIQLSEVPDVEGLPLSPNSQVMGLLELLRFCDMLMLINVSITQEPHKSAYKYLLKLIAALKHELQRRVCESHLK